MVLEIGTPGPWDLGLWDLGIYLFLSHSESPSEIPCESPESHSESPIKLRSCYGVVVEGVMVGC